MVLLPLITKNKMNKKGGYTLIEALVSMLVVSIVAMSAIAFAGGYFKTTVQRDMQIKAVFENMNTIEKLRAEVKSVPQLYDFSQGNNIKIIAIGVGEVALTQVGETIEFTVLSNENYGFSQKLLRENSLFRIEVGGDLPNTKLITILRLGAEDGD
ncbi:MAG: type II secretion system protein [Candidatus Moranbacteria bacterium]|nr:type II secretion system protein [Candidatus Moranbacteria bacterium]